MRLIFAGTPEFARVALHSLHAAGFEVALVLTQPDRSAGRGMKLQASAVKQFALAHGMALAQPRSLRLDGRFPEDAAAASQAMAAARADAMVVAAYGLILPPWALAAPRWGCFNIHASLLPRWRGAAPIQRAIEAGDAQTGVTIMQMDAGLDSGDMLLAESLPIRADDSAASLHDRLAALGARLLLQTLRLAATAELRPLRQPAVGVTYAQKIQKQEAAIDWSASAALIERRVRAFNPSPGVATALAGEPIKVWTAHTETVAPAAACGTPGQVLSIGADGIRVQTGDGVLVLTELQRAGGKRLPAAEFLRGFALRHGQVFDPGTAAALPG